MRSNSQVSGLQKVSSCQAQVDHTQHCSPALAMEKSLAKANASSNSEILAATPAPGSLVVEFFQLGCFQAFRCGNP